MNKKTHKIKKNSSATTSPDFCNLVQGYLWSINGQPGSPKPESPDLTRTTAITSQEIVLALADMADININDVAASMTHLGYICGAIDGKLGWLVSTTRP